MYLYISYYFRWRSERRAYTLLKNKGENDESIANVILIALFIQIGQDLK